MTKDWKGNSNSVFKTHGSSNHCLEDREINDFYATSPKAIDILCDVEAFEGIIWEPCCGQGHLSESLINRGYTVLSTDLIDRGYGIGGIDFLKEKVMIGNNIITNPPYSLALEFCKHGLELLPENGKMAMFLKLTFMEGKKRKSFFLENPPKTVYVSSSRIACAKNGDFKKMKEAGSSIAYAWYIWEKGFKGNSIIKWIN